MSIERNFDIAFVSSLALREKQIQQNYRPVIAVHKWFARRPGTLFRGLILAEFSDQPLEKAFYQANDLSGRTIADPFMGGGTPLLEANRVGCDVIGFDINPMAVWIVREALEHLDLSAYKAAASFVTRFLEENIRPYYSTGCVTCGNNEVPVKYFLWVKTQKCDACGVDADLFPGYLLAEDTRHPKNVLVCKACGELNEVSNLEKPGRCFRCSQELVLLGPARHNHWACPSCGHSNVYPKPTYGVPNHRMFAIEYHCSSCKRHRQGRFFKKPEDSDIQKFLSATARWHQLDPAFVPTEPIPPGDETTRLLRWGYQRYCDLFNPRQLLALELTCRAIDKTEDKRLKFALATNLSDLLRYQNMLCRYDTMALKSLDIFSIHGFPVGLIQCESNFIGIPTQGGTNIGSGGWTNITEKYIKAKDYCHNPFEVRHHNSRKKLVPIKGEWIGEHFCEKTSSMERRVLLRCQDARLADLLPNSLDAVLTDPPYFGNVQYGELMDFCYVWLRRLVGNASEGFQRRSTRSPDELTGNLTMGRGLEQFTEGLGSVFTKMVAALKPGGPLAFTYHHNKPDAYHAVGVAILDAGLVCSGSLPCPAEMAGSIHIHGTGSSIVDTIFVCRTTGKAPRRWLFPDAQELALIVEDELAQLRAGGLKPSAGDVKCVIYGHLTRMAVWLLRKDWQRQRPTLNKIQIFGEVFAKLGRVEDVLALLRATPITAYRCSDLFHPTYSSQGFKDAVAF